MRSRTAIAFLLGCAAAAAQQSALNVAIRGGDVKRVSALIAAGTDPNAQDAEGHRPVFEAVQRGEVEALRLLIAAGADVNAEDKGLGSPLEAAEREGRTEAAALLRKAGARGSGKSIGDKVCVRPWKGDGYCGSVEAVAGTGYRIRITNVVGCRDGCSPRPDCSAGKAVGGLDGLKPGDTVATPVACLTHTGVAK